MEYYVADTYKNMKRISEPIKENGRLYTIVEGNCDRCGGSGRYGWGAVINGSPQHVGVCLKCGGTGKVSKKVRLYTEKEYASAQKAKENRKVRTEKAAAERKSKRFSNWLKWNGFDEEGNTYLIYGNTYPIKNSLKEAGCKFSQELKWHGPAAVDVPEDCFIERIHWSDVYNWHEDVGEMWRTEEGDQFLSDIFSKNSLGMYLGEIGERLRNIPVIFEKRIEFTNEYQGSYVYRFNADGAQLSWFTSVNKNLEEGAEYFLTGTVKKQQLYGNVKTTYLNRCKIEEV